MTTDLTEAAAGGSSGPEGAALLSAARRRLPSYLHRLDAVIRAAARGPAPEAAQRVGDVVRAAGTECGVAFSAAGVQDGAGTALGEVLVGHRAGPGTSHVVLSAHLDLSGPPGPGIDERGRAAGRGTAGAAGLLAALAAVEVLDDLERAAFGQVVIVLAPDRASRWSGSASSMVELAGGADAVLGTDCAAAVDTFVAGREGILEVAIPATGADHRLLWQDRMAELTAGWPEVGVTVVTAGSDTVVRVRSGTGAHLAAALGAVERLAAEEPASARIRSAVPPWTVGQAGAAAQQAVQDIGRSVGLTPQWVDLEEPGETNVLGMRCPVVLDGFGPVHHRDGEDSWIDLPTVPARVALLAGLLDRLSAA